MVQWCTVLAFVEGREFKHQAQAVGLDAVGVAVGGKL